MTIKDLIDYLETIEDKSLPVYLNSQDYVWDGTGHIFDYESEDLPKRLFLSGE